MIKKKAIVTGGAGFIGSHMVDLLISKNYYVIVIDSLVGGHKRNLKQHLKNKNFKLIKQDICSLDSNSILFKNVDYVYHFAGIGDIVPSIENPLNYMMTNVIGTTKVLENCRNQKIKKFVYAASSSCYGLAKTPTNEDHKISPEYPYALSKLMGEQACLHWSKVYKIPTISIRIFNAYGPRVKTSGVYGAVFGVFFKQKLENKPLTVVGNGLQKRDFLNVKDVANAFYMSAISKRKNEVYNLGSGSPKKILDLIKLLGTNKVVKLPKRPGEPDCTWADTKKIKRQINWKPNISFKNGVNEMLLSIDKWKNAPLWNKKNIKKATKTWFKYLS